MNMERNCRGSGNILLCLRNEGDSFTMAFHDALDAVKFCLKVILL